jgi:tetratricopeptide (TPR) repeat protein/transcriptional regulator with XRE-family HTH domain
VGRDAEAQSDFGGVLRRRRLAAGLSQEGLAQRAGLSERTIRDLERGVTGRPYRNSVGRLAQALGLTGADREGFARAARPVPGDGGQRPASRVPRQLPAAAADFTGRTAELKILGGLLDSAGRPGTVVVSAIGGTAGVGKTALAVHWAHQVAERFPDGQLYVDLRGYDPDQPMPPADALAGLLRALGVPGQEIPPEEDERAARYRSLLAGRRMLVLIDNAGSAEQVRPLLPGSAGCAAIVTSRDSLSGLVARDGARRLDLDLLQPADADGLLTALIGDRAAADPGATAALAARCSRLPLALRVAAELAVTRPEASVADLAGELTDEQRRLDLLEAGGDPRTAVRAVFSWSYRYLDAASARAFRLAGLHPGADFDAYAVAALTDTTVEQSGRVLGLLAGAHLIHVTAQGRYGLHDLLRAYARERAAGQDGEDASRAALTRLFDHYLHAAAEAMDVLYPAAKRRRPRIPVPATPAPPVTGPDGARAWLDSERASLVTVAAHTAAHGWPGHATRLAATLYRYLDTGGHYPEALVIHTRARGAARDTGDRAAEAEALNGLGLVDWRQGRLQQAADRFRQALALFRDTGDRLGEARSLGNIGLVEFFQGRYQQAADCQRQAVTLFRETGDQVGEALARSNLAGVDLRQGHYEEAAAHYEQALILCSQTGDLSATANTLGNLGEANLRQGRYEQATSNLQRALALFRETVDANGEAYVLGNLGGACLRQGRHQQATGYLRQALDIFRQTGEPTGEALALNGLGDVLLATGEPGQARAWHTAALDLASQIGDKYEQARARDGLGRGHHAAGDSGQARRHWEQALALYTGLGAPEADQVRARLASQAPAGSEQAE